MKKWPLRLISVCLLMLFCPTSNMLPENWLECLIRVWIVITAATWTQTLISAALVKTVRLVSLLLLLLFKHNTRSSLTQVARRLLHPNWRQGSIYRTWQKWSGTYIKSALLASHRNWWTQLVFEQKSTLVGRIFHPGRRHGWCPVRATEGSLPCWRYLK